MRTIIISDVHGCYDELQELLDKVDFHKDEDTIVFVGDIMDRGPKSYDAFKFVKNLKEEMGDKCHYVMGNHEDFIFRAKYDRNDYKIWAFYNGGADTIQDFADHNEVIYDYVDWIEKNTELYYETEDYIVCHGGCRSDVHTDIRDDIIWDRDCVEYGRYSGKLLIVGHTPLPCPQYSGIKFGKPTAYRIKYAEKEQYELSDFPTGCIDIDTGCVFGYWMTAMVIEDGKFRLHRVKNHKPAGDADDGIDGEEGEEYSFYE